MSHFHCHATDNHNFLTHVDARIKLLCALALLAMVIGGKGFVFPLVVAALGISLCLFMGVRLKTLALRLIEPGFIMVMIILLKLFFTGHSPLFSFNAFGIEITGHRDGLLDGLRIACRITGAVTVVMTLGFAATFTELMSALSWLRVPGGFIEISLFAWRYLFLLFDDARVIYDAQKNRLGYTGCRRGLRSFGALTGSLVIKAFDNSRNVTTAMVQRGYDGNLPALRHKPFRIREIAATVAFLALMGVFWKI